MYSDMLFLETKFELYGLEVKVHLDGEPGIVFLHTNQEKQNRVSERLFRNAKSNFSLSDEQLLSVDVQTEPMEIQS